ncbi:MAG: hypothetical protein FJ403_19010 [Verrucomicrobia bacterium]|nr:hypothetical protein [Verrucomicrobiota bacterium]
MKALVCIPNHGAKQLSFLERVLLAWDSMTQFRADIILHTTEQLDLSRYAFKSEQILCDPALRFDLAFEHRKVMVERQDQYDLFIYSENDVLITETNLLAFCEATQPLPFPYVVGFVRFERNRKRSEDQELYLPDVHPSVPYFEGRVEIHGRSCLVLRNKHQGCFVLTREQLKWVIQSGHFTGVLPPPLRSLEVAATLVYLMCGLKKVLPMDYIDSLMIHHMSDKYVNADEPPWNITPPRTLKDLKAEFERSRS